MVTKKTSYTYFIKNKRSGNIKIGKSTNPSSRLHSLMTATADPLIILFKIDEQILSERQAHIMFRHARIVREWFRGTPDIYQFINDNLESQRLEKIAKRKPAVEIQNLGCFHESNDFFKQLNDSIKSISNRAA